MRYFSALLLVIFISIELSAQSSDAGNINLSGKLMVSGQVLDSNGYGLSATQLSIYYSSRLYSKLTTDSSGFFTVEINTDSIKTAGYGFSFIKFQKNEYTPYYFHLNNQYEFEADPNNYNLLVRMRTRVEQKDYVKFESIPICKTRKPHPFINPRNPSSQTTWTAEDISHFPRW